MSTQRLKQQQRSSAVGVMRLPLAEQYFPTISLGFACIWQVANLLEWGLYFKFLLFMHESTVGSDLVTSVHGYKHYKSSNENMRKLTTSQSNTSGKKNHCLKGKKHGDT